MKFHVFSTKKYICYPNQSRNVIITPGGVIYLKHVFIIKPSKKSSHIEETIVNIMHSYDYVIEYTKFSKHAITIAKSYRQQVCRIYAVGGDGMVHEVVQGMMGSNNELVVLPNGTGNDFIRSIANTTHTKKLLEASLTLEAQYIDLIKANDIYCVNVLCCAFDSDIANHAHTYKNIWFLPSGLQYFTVLFRRLVNYQFFPTVLHHKGKEIFNDRLVIGAFCNARYFGGGFKIGNKADIQDGKLDISLVSGIKKRSIPKYLLLLLLGNIHKTHKSFYKQVDQIDIESSIDINIDGETYPKGKYHLEVVPNKIKVVIFK